MLEGLHILSDWGMSWDPQRGVGGHAGEKDLRATLLGLQLRHTNPDMLWKINGRMACLPIFPSLHFGTSIFKELLKLTVLDKIAG